LLNKRLPTTYNLARQGVLSHRWLSCSSCSQKKSINHLFLECGFFQEVWFYVQHWLGISSVLPLTLVYSLFNNVVLIILRKIFVYTFISFGWLVFRLFERKVIFEFSKTNIHLLLRWLTQWNSILGAGLRCLDPMTLLIFMLGGLTLWSISVAPACNDGGWTLKFLFPFAFLVVVLWAL